MKDLPAIRAADGTEPVGNGMFRSANRVIAGSNEACQGCAEPVRTRISACILGFRSVGTVASGSVILLAFLILVSGCRTSAPLIAYQRQDLGFVTDVQPLAVQPDLGKWKSVTVGMTETEVTTVLGMPYQKDPRPAAETNSTAVNLYSWKYGEITFNSFNTKGSYLYAVIFHDGRVHEISDPWNGKFSPDGGPTVPELVLPDVGQTLQHYPRFMDFRWRPSSGAYPIEYEVVIQVLAVTEYEAEHYEDYVRKTVDRSRTEWIEAGQSRKAADEGAVAFARVLRESQGVQLSFSFRTHDIYLPFTWVGANSGRWRIRAVNSKGISEWTAWRYFKFSV